MAKPRNKPAAEVSSAGEAGASSSSASDTHDGHTIDVGPVVVGQPTPPLEVDASRLTPRPIGPFRGGIITNHRGRCAVCDGAADHVHTRPGLPDHVHKGED